MLSNQKKIQHLFLRAGFMPGPSSVNALLNYDINAIVDRAFLDSNASSSLQSGDEDEAMEDKKDLSQVERKELQKKRAHGIKQLNEEWMNLCCTTTAVLREKMTLFWHGHFACRSPLGYYSRLLNNSIREHALGNFGDLLTSVSKSAAMLQFLNNQQNRKNSPNENFAREVMELFTLGRGNYTENDIKNGARAFTGWRFKLNGDFEFKQEQHDEGEKTFLGRTGNFTGDDILNMIMENPQTARYITRKIYAYFVNEVIDEDRCTDLAHSFQANYDIGKLMHKILTSDWFYDEVNVGNKIKSPVELLVNMNRAVPVIFKNPDVIIYGQKVLGQVLFMPPNVAGWPGGRNWIDSSSLMFRLSIPGIAYNQADMYIKPKESPEEDEHKMMQEEQEREEEKPKRVGRFFAQPDWTGYINGFANVKDDDLYTAIADYLIQPVKPEFKMETITKYIVRDNRESFIKSLTVALMSLPEYQMC